MSPLSWQNSLWPFSCRLDRNIATPADDAVLRQSFVSSRARDNRILTNHIELVMSKRHDPLPDGASPTSSRPHRLPKKQLELFRDVLTILENRNIPLAVSGTYALQMHTGTAARPKISIFFFARKKPLLP